jgi:hypothetical protein
MRDGHRPEAASTRHHAGEAEARALTYTHKRRVLQCYMASSRRSRNQQRAVLEMNIDSQAHWNTRGRA